LGDPRCDHRRVNDEATVEVTGHGTATTVPDRVQIALAAVARAPEVGRALEECEQAMRAMLAAVSEQGVPSADVRSTHVEVGAGHERGRRTGFRASSAISVTVNDVEAAGDVVTAAVAAGGSASRVRGMSLTTSASQEALSAARDAAWANALAKARQYADLAGRDLGTVVNVRERPRDRFHDGVALAAAGGRGPGLSIEPGARSVRASVTVRWRLV
jgi:uncharacterized protein